MAYIGLGFRPVTATLNDPSGRNPGNWTAVMGPGQMTINHNYFELYHLALTNGPPGSVMTWYVDNGFYDTTPNGYLNSWDPNQPLLLTPGDTCYFYWNSATGTAPEITAYFRYDNLLG